MKKRIIAAAIALPAFLIVLLVLPQIATAILFALVCAVAAWELMFSTGLVRHLRLFIYSAIMAAAVYAEVTNNGRYDKESSYRRAGATGKST